jgi:hypothetical protein
MIPSQWQVPRLPRIPGRQPRAPFFAAAFANASTWRGAATAPKTPPVAKTQNPARAPPRRRAPPAGAHNKRYADETGAVWRQVDPSRGVAWSDYGAARGSLGRQCQCAPAA